MNGRYGRYGNNGKDENRLAQARSPIIPIPPIIPMPLIRWENLSGPAVAALDRARTLLLLPVSPIEEHGPHLPLGVDVWDAEYFSTHLANRYAEEEPGSTVAELG